MRGTRHRSVALGLAASIAGGFLLARCGAQDAKAPVETQQTTSNGCSIEATMPAFYHLLTSNSQPLAGIKKLVDALASGPGNQPQGDALLEVIEAAIQGLGNFAQDPAENNGACIVVSASIAPPDAPLCSISTATPCESRMCALRRALDFGVKDNAANAALSDLQPLLAKIIGYISGTGPGAEDHTNYEIVNVLQQMASNEDICEPSNLIAVLDGTIVYTRSNRTCFPNCPGQTMLGDLQALIEDPAMQSFLLVYQNSQSTGQGRASFQALAQLLESDLANMPTDSHYFDQIQALVNTLVSFLQGDNTSGQYDGLIEKINAVTADLKAFLDPTRPGAINVPLKAVVNCIESVDMSQQVVGALYDLLSQPGGPNGNGLDLSDLTNSLVSISTLDKDGVLAGALHAVLASVGASPADMELIREMLVDILTPQNAQDLLPPLQTMITAGVVPEFLTFLDDIVYGCQASVSENP